MPGVRVLNAVNESRSSRYHRHRRWAEGLALVARALLLLGIVLSGLSRSLGSGLQEAVASLSASDASVEDALIGDGLNAAMAMVLFGPILSVLGDVVALPFSWYSRFFLERRYRAARVGLSAWCAGYGRVMALHASLWMGAGLVVHLIIASWPSLWWLVTGAVFGLVTLALSHLGPVLVLPRQYAVQPLDRPVLRARLDALVNRVGAPRLAIHELKLGLDAPPRAALVGLWATRQVLLSDSLLADYTDDEIEVVVAHELAHHLNHDTWRTFGYEAVAAITVCGAVHLVLTWAGPVLNTGPVGTVETLPIMALVAGVLAMAVAPIGNHISRRQERRADLDALEMTNRPDALASGLRRLAEQNLAEERPSLVVRSLFNTHPPLAERLEAAASARTHAADAISLYHP